MTDCKSIQENLTAYLDLELSKEERMKIKNHLSECTACLNELNELKKVGQWIHLVQTESDPYFENQILRKIKIKGERKSADRFGKFGIGNLFLFPTFRRTVLALVFFISVGISYYLGVISHPFWVAQGVGMSQRDLEKINQEIDFYQDYDLIDRLDILNKMNQKKEEGNRESL